MSVVETPTLVPSDTLLALLDGIAAELLSGTRPGVSLAQLSRTDDQIVKGVDTRIVELLNTAVRNRSNGVRYEVIKVPSYYFRERIKGAACYLGLIATDGDLKIFTVGPYSPGLRWGTELEGEARAEAKAKHEESERLADYRTNGKDEAELFVFRMASDLSRRLRHGKLNLSAEREADLNTFLHGREVANLNLEDLAAACKICGSNLDILARAI